MELKPSLELEPMTAEMFVHLRLMDISTSRAHAATQLLLNSQYAFQPDKNQLCAFLYTPDFLRFAGLQLAHRLVSSVKTFYTLCMPELNLFCVAVDAQQLRWTPLHLYCRPSHWRSRNCSHCRCHSGSGFAIGVDVLLLLLPVVGCNPRCPMASG